MSRVGIRETLMSNPYKFRTRTESRVALWVVDSPICQAKNILDWPYFLFMDYLESWGVIQILRSNMSTFDPFRIVCYLIENYQVSKEHLDLSFGTNLAQLQFLYWNLLTLFSRSFLIIRGAFFISFRPEYVAKMVWMSSKGIFLHYFLGNRLFLRIYVFQILQNPLWSKMA